MIFSIAMGADEPFYVKFIATEAPTFFGYIISVLASVFPEDCRRIVHKLEVLGFRKAVLLEVFPMSPDDAAGDESSKMFFDTQHCKIDLKNTKHTTTV